MNMTFASCDGIIMDRVVTALNDPYACLRCPDGATLDLQVGDRIGLGISHPCTTFDKWRWMALVDDDYNVCDAIVTSF
jgi:D-serine dehydratase